jgi:Cu(I)/Ag(I) efflux system membrane protein CusA/SilA
MSRFGQNALEVIHNVKAKVTEISAGLPEGVTIQAVYDRSDLIHRAIENLSCARCSRKASSWPWSASCS